ncbi:hypothetical protein D3C80_1443040 [compost metagenome]
MRMHADGHLLPLAEVATEPFDLVGINVRGTHLHGGGQVDNHGPLAFRLPHVRHCLTNLQGKLQLGKAEGLWRILETPVSFRMPVAPLANTACAIHRQRHGSGFVLLENDVAKHRGGGVIQMHNGTWSPL